MSKLDKTFAMIESRFENLLFFDQMSPTKLKKLNEMLRRAEPKHLSEATEDERKAHAKEQAQHYREWKREQQWDEIREFLQIGIDIKSDDTNSELYKTAKELQDIVDKSQAEPLLVSKHEKRKFRTVLGRYKALLKAELKAEQEQPKKSAEKDRESKNGEKAKGSMLKMMVSSSKDNWKAIKSEYGISKMVFGKKINFVSDSFKREIIFRDVEHAYVLASEGFAKPAVILAGGVIEELLRLYLKHKNIATSDNTFNEYIRACKQNKLLQTGIRKLSDSAREFRNFVHLSKESAKKHTITKAAAKGAVSSIFIIANDL